MTHFRDIALDEGAYDGRFHGLRDDTGLNHSGRWDEAHQCFVYANDAPIRATIVSYNARMPGNPRSEGTAV